MHDVVEFPSSRVRGGALPLCRFTQALEEVAGTDARAFQSCTIMDRAGMAVLALKRLCSGVGVAAVLRRWDDDARGYAEVFMLLLSVGRRGSVTDVTDWYGKAAPRKSRRELLDTLELAREALGRNTVVRIVS